MAITVPCDFCGEPAKTNNSKLKQFKHTFCSQKCYGSWQKAQHKPKSKPCATCGEPVFASPARLKKKVFCSKECFRLSQFKTETNPCKYCGDPVTRRPSEFRKGGKHVFCSHECCDNFRRGKPHPDPEHGEKVSRKLKGRKANLSPEGREALSKVRRKRLLDPEIQAKMQEGLREYHKIRRSLTGELPSYGPEFTSRLRESIRKRDGYICQFCGCSQEENLRRYNKRLSVHHINYDKRDSDPLNLISLCLDCHIATNRDRIYWKDYFQRMSCS